MKEQQPPIHPEDKKKTPLPGSATQRVRPGEMSTVSDVSSEDPNVGRSFDHYLVLRRIGEGGMGSVYLARDLSLDRLVALKVLSIAGARNPEISARFMREAKSQARVTHPNVAHVYYVGSANQIPFFAMEYVEGTSLEDLLDAAGPVEPRDAVTWTIQLAEALASARRHGVTHRDIKPSNVIVSAEGFVKLTDFGLAKAAGEKAITQKGAVIGTPYYISPEQIRGKNADFKSDMYSLGATLYHMVFGEPPFDDDTVPQLLDRHLKHPLKIPYRPNLPLLEKIGRVIERMMQKDPSKRYRSYAELISALYRVRPHRLKFATSFQRMIAVLEDYALAGVLVVAGGEAIVRALEWLMPNVSVEGPNRLFLRDCLWMIILVAFGLVLKRSPGKAATRIVVLDRTGQPASRLVMGFRGFFHFIPVLIFLWYSHLARMFFAGTTPPGWHRYLAPAIGIGWVICFCWQFIDRQRRMPHDLILRTVVVMDEK